MLQDQNVISSPTQEENNDEHHQPIIQKPKINYKIILKLSDDNEFSHGKALDDIELDLRSEFELFGGIYQFVKPHKTNHRTNVRTRWFKKTTMEVLSSEFKMPEQVSKEMIEKGIITLTTQKPTSVSVLEYKLRSNDQIVTVDWKNEKPVLYREFIRVLYHDDEFLVIDKPSSIPVHPAGRFVKNSLHYLLESALGRKLFLIHRLDKVTSGVLIHTWNAALAKSYQDTMKEGNVRKCYLAQVYGEFPETENMSGEHVLLNGQSFHKDKEGFIHVKNKMVYKQNDWTFIWRADSSENGSDSTDPKNTDTAYTLVKRIYYDPASSRSIVIAIPITGRTHQIREHLRVMGYPIINDVGFELVDKGENWENPWPEKWEIMKRNEQDETQCAKEMMQMQWERFSKEEPKDGEFLIHLHAFYYSFHGEKCYEFYTQLPEWCNHIPDNAQFFETVLKNCQSLDVKSKLGTIL
ncbi:predicted protein [Naegleria gruberi]|uniref:Predicted protein n=1 Tax=Naegleria gruberi TaxID=5762 RepID=D2VYL5_NAEGR|nr:uncharacterized protein NAEGRDRAFT_59599 [Naegleria gruberi]EFC38135.1 predicted protein [Naegleria gruberi]|eukprot:XP_002670879.1 predicted protein [Naegleria gruberi strain NEG-M]